MEKDLIKQFKDKTNIEIITELMKIGKGYITSRLITELGIHRMYLKIMEDRNIIRKVGNGIYVESNKTDIDDYYIFSLENSKVIFSHLTALYLYGVYPKEPKKYDITVSHKYHNKKINTENVYYIINKFYNLGITEIKSPKGNMVKVYDVSKSICDIIRFKEDEKIIKACMKEYIKKYDNYEDLIHYAEILKVKDKVNKYYQEAKKNIK